MKIERRYTPLASIGLRRRASENGDGNIIAGRASVFYDGTTATELDVFGDGSFVERIDSSAFDRALAETDDVRGLFNHDPNQILGRTASGTMRLAKGDGGLDYSIDVADSLVAQAVVTAIDRKDVTGSSFSFSVTDQEFTTEDQVDIRTITGVKLFDVGPVTFPAYDATSAGLRSVDGDLDGVRELLAEYRSRRADKRLRRVDVRARSVEVQKELDAMRQAS